MSGGVSPFEWIFPPLAIAHHALDASGVKIDTPGSPRHKQSKAEGVQRQLLSELQANQSRQQQLEQQKLAEYQPGAVRRRAEAASEALGTSGRRRASEYLGTA